jgi:CheY-like chemotaxis protein
MTTSAPSRDNEARELVTIVDDDASVRQSMDRLVRSFGYRTRVFGSADEFLASTAPDQAACLLLDLCMPGTDGLTLQRLPAERGARIAIVFVTAVHVAARARAPPPALPRGVQRNRTRHAPPGGRESPGCAPAHAHEGLSPGAAGDDKHARAPIDTLRRIDGQSR